MSNNAEEEVICSACGFSSAFVPEGMISCHRCFVVYYCSKECRDWEFASGGHDKVCQPVTLSSFPSKEAQASPIKNDRLLGDSFNNSEGGSTSHASIDVLHLFEKNRSPLILKNKVLQSSVVKSSAVSPKTHRAPIAESNLYIPSSPHSEIQTHSSSNDLKQSPTSQKSVGTLGMFLESTSPHRQAKPAIAPLFQLHRNADGSGEDDDDDDQDVNPKSFMNMYFPNQRTECAEEEESVGLSVLKDESAANLTAIAEESKLMSGPVVEASWRRRNSAISTETASVLDMNDSAIIGAVTTSLMDEMNGESQSFAESLASSNSNEDTHENSAVLNLLSVCTSLQSDSNNQLDEQEFDYSENTEPNPSNRAESLKTESNVHPEVMESSNSTEASDLRISVVGTLGRPSPIQGLQALRSFREVYNECDTVSLHSRSLARSSSSSENSLSSHDDNFEKGSELPERLNRSSASLKDFRDIYNADLDKPLLPHHHSCSSIYSSSIGFDDCRTEEVEKASGDINKDCSVVKMKQDSTSENKRNDLSSQLRALSTEKGSAKTSKTTVIQAKAPHSPSSKSGDDSTLLLARIRNESMKDSLNTALRVYEQLYGEDAAKDVFYQLTSKTEPNAALQEQTSGEQTFDWKRSRSVVKEVAPSNSLLVRNGKALPNDGLHKSNSLPRYMKYRTSLSSTSLSDSHICQDKKQAEIMDVPSDCEHPTRTTLASSASFCTSSYSQYRNKLTGSAGTDLTSLVDNAEKLIHTKASETESETSNVFSKGDGETKLSAHENETPVATGVSSKPRYESYRTSLINNTPECQSVSGELGVSLINDQDAAEVTHPLYIASSNELPTSTRELERKSGYWKYRQMLGKPDEPVAEVCDQSPMSAYLQSREQIESTKEKSIAHEALFIAKPATISDLEIEQRASETAPKQRYLQYRSSLQKLTEKEFVHVHCETFPSPDLSINNSSVNGKSENHHIPSVSDSLQQQDEVSSMQQKSDRQTPRYMKYRASLLNNETKESQNLKRDDSMLCDENVSKDDKVDDSVTNVVEDDKFSAIVPVIQLSENVEPISSLMRDMERYELKALGVNESMCIMANTKDLLKVWSEVESDRKRLNAQRIASSSENSKPRSLAELPPTKAADILNVVEKHEGNDRSLDIEVGKQLVHSSSSWSEYSMKKRANQHQLKQRSWCGFLIFILVALPICIGLGIGLTGNEPSIERKPVVVGIPSVSPTTSGTSNHLTKAPDSSFMPVTNVPTRQPVTAPVESTPGPTARGSSSPTTSPVSSAPTASPVSKNSTQVPTIFQPENSVELYRLLANASLDNGSAIKSSGSPQSLAFQWLASSPDLLISFSGLRIIQRYALATIYFSTDGPRWSDSIGWLSEANECSWFTTASQENCNAESLFLNLNLGANDLTGVIPNELAMLTNLQSLTLSGGPTRFLGGIIPSAIGAMTKLTVLDLQENSLFGGIPSELSDLKNLEVLNLSLNRLARAIPSDIGRLTSLKSLNLAMNDLTGVIPTSIQSLTQLEKLSLGNNNLGGQVAIRSSLVMLNEFNVENNRFTSIGTEIGLLTSLRLLTMYDNDILDDLPTQIGNLTMLERLDLHKNSLTGSIPTEVGRLLRLKDLDLSNNNITSTIPTEIGLLTNLSKLNLQSNLLEGPIPEELGNLTAASIIKIDDNNISGEMPQGLCDQFFITPTIYADCLEASDGTTKLSCPDEQCCAFCCNEESGCVCSLIGTMFEVFCSV